MPFKLWFCFKINHWFLSEQTCQWSAPKSTFTHWKTLEGLALISVSPPSPPLPNSFKNIQASALSFAFFASNQIPFVLCTCPLSLKCVFGVTKKKKHVTMRTLREVSHRWKPATLKSFAFLPEPLAPGLIKSMFLSLCLFFAKCRLFLENRPRHMCELRSCFWGRRKAQIKADSKWVSLTSGQCQDGLTQHSGRPDEADRKLELKLGHLKK